jgi:hypothetical protein
MWITCSDPSVTLAPLPKGVKVGASVERGPPALPARLRLATGTTVDQRNTAAPYQATTPTADAQPSTPAKPPKHPSRLAIQAISAALLKKLLPCVADTSIGCILSSETAGTEIDAVRRRSGGRRWRPALPLHGRSIAHYLHLCDQDHGRHHRTWVPGMWFVRNNKVPGRRVEAQHRPPTDASNSQNNHRR